MPENTTPEGENAPQIPSFGMEADDPSVQVQPEGEHVEGDETSESTGRRSRRARRGRGSTMVLRALGLPGGESQDDETPESADADESVGTEGAVEGDDVADNGADGKPKKSGRRQRPKKPTERLDSVLQDSVPGPAISRIAQCDAFEIEDGLFAALLLDVDDIGGLNKKSANNADKGTIIHAMSNDKISIVATRELLDKDQLIVIPDTDTLKMIEEFSLLSTAPYTWVIVDTNSKSELVYETAGAATYQLACQVALEEKSIGDVVHRDTTHTAAQIAEATQAGSAPAASAMPSSAATSTPAPAPAERTMPAQGAAGGQGETNGNVAAPAEPVVPIDDFGDDDGEGDDDAQYDENGEYIDPEDDDPEGRYDDDAVSVEQVDEVITRRFHDERLGIEITTQEFEEHVASYKEFTPFIPLDTRGSSWLQDVVAAYTDAANAEIQALHDKNIEKARQTYIELVSNGVVEIDRRTSINDPKTMYGKLKSLLDAEVDGERSRVERLTGEELVRLREEYTRARETAANAAAESARARYDDENQARLDRETKEVPERMANFIADMRQNRLDDITRDRREAAKAHIDAMITQSIQAMRPMFDAYRESEVELSREWTNKIATIVDQHLKDDIARTQTLQADLDRTNKIEAITQAHRAELDEKSAQYEQHTRELTQRLTQEQAQAEAALAGLRESLQARIDEAEGNARAGRERVEALESQLATLQEKADERRESEVRAVNQARAADIEEWNKRWGTAVMVRRMLYLVMVVLVVLAGIAMYILGARNAQNGMIDISTWAQVWGDLRL